MKIVPHPQSLRLALYARVSTDEQAKRENIGQQLDLGRAWAKANSHTIVREYLDDGVTGTMFFDDRGGKELLADGRAGLFDGVVIREVDRLCRDEEVGFQAVRVIKNAGLLLFLINEGIAIDPRAPDESDDLNVGIRILFAAQNKKKQIRVMNQGRDYRAETGRWTNGPVPFGLDLDRDPDRAHHLILSDRVIPHLDRTESDIMREVLLHLLDGVSLGKECDRLNALGVPLISRWRDDRDGNKRERISRHPWYRERLNRMATNPIYKGVHELASRYGTRTVEVPALISPEQWDILQEKLARNKSLPKRNTRRDWLLRGLIRCANCGHAFVAHVAPSRSVKAAYSYYWCGSHRSTVAVRPPCGAKNVPAEWLEEEVWDWCRSFARDPGPVLDQARAEFEQGTTSGDDETAREHTLRQRKAAKEAERERVMALFTEANLITIEEVKTRTKKINDEIAVLQRDLDELVTEAATMRAYEGKLAAIETNLDGLRAEVEEIDRTGDMAKKQEVIRRLVSRIDVDTGGEARRKTATVTIHYTFGEAGTLETPSPFVPGATRPTTCCADYKHAPLIITYSVAVPMVFASRAAAG